MNTIQTYESQTPESGKLAAVQGGGGCCAPSSGGAMGRMKPRWFGGRRGLIVGAIAVGGAGLAFGWPTLVALGIAPILISLAPCAAMCALGLCMMGKGRQGGPTQSNTVQQVPAGDQTPALLTAQAEASPSPDAYLREPAGLA